MTVFVLGGTLNLKSVSQSDAITQY